MSVSVASPERQPDELLVGHPGFALVELTVEDLAAVGQELVRAPTKDDPHHAEVVGRKTKATRKTLARSATWVVRPPPR